MPQGASYPSPNSTQMGEGPFYTTQHQMPVSEDVQTPTPLAHRGPPATEQFDRGEEDGLEAAHRAQELRHSQLASPQQLAQSGLESTPLYDNNSADSASRKRSKVSRACDECRRKKIKCDAISEAAGAQCSGCRRSDAPCMFSRTPQKRGPSKGYIKELADRVGALEGRRPVASMAGYQYNAYNEYSPQPDDVGFGRKRTHSMSEGLHNSPYLQDQIQDQVGRYSGAPNMDWSNREIVQHALGRETNYSINMPNEQTLQENPLTSSLRQDGQQIGLEQSEVMGNRASAESEARAIELRDDAVDEYYRVVHATFPLLPDTKAQMNTYFAKASPMVRKAFASALSHLAKVTSAAQPSPASNGPDERVIQYQIAIQAELFDCWTQHDNVLYLQTLILMILATDIYPRSPCRTSIWYGLASTVSSFLQLHVKKDSEVIANVNMISIDMIARKCWLILVVLDRWYAASASYPPAISDRGVYLSPSDHALLGDQFYHLTRLSLALGSLVDSVLYVETPMGANSISGRRISDALHMSLERLRESIEPTFPTSPLIRLAYLHVRILNEWYWAGDRTGGEDVNGMALEMADLLCTAQYPTNPLTQHFASLAAIILKESLRYPANELAFRKLDDLRQWVEKGGKLGWEPTLLQFLTGASMPNQRAPPEILPTDQNSINRGGLQFLANAAVGEPSASGGGLVREEVVRAAAPAASAAPAAAAPGRDVSSPPLRTLLGYLTMIKRASA